jgi:hypothetical protein
MSPFRKPPFAARAPSTPLEAVRTERVNRVARSEQVVASRRAFKEGSNVR